MSTLKVPIKGMHCASCEVLISENLKKLPGVTAVKVDHRRGEAIINFKDQPPSEQVIKQTIKDSGYEVGKNEKLPWLSTDPREYKDLVFGAVILAILFLIAQWLNLGSYNVASSPGGVLVALAVGLVAGVSTCMALVGGLILSLSARHAELHPEATGFQKFRPHLYFNLGRIVGYALLGGLIGAVGSVFRPATNILGLLTMLIGAVMIFFGLKLIAIFPVLKNTSITLPAGIARVFGLQKQQTEYSAKGSMLMGMLTFFLPCGFTQAMQLYAVSTGSFWQGMMIMGLFALGTAPGLLGIGGLTSVFKGHKAKIFFTTAGLAVIVLGWFNVANGSHLIGAPVNYDQQSVAVTDDNVQEVRMQQNGSGYSPNTLTIAKGRPVKWIIDSTSPYSCSVSLVMPKYGINRTLSPGENVIEFTPTETGEIPFSCSMGMYRGQFIVTQ